MKLPDETGSQLRANLTTLPILRSSPYWPVVTHPQWGRVLPGLFVSAIGDGMALVAVSWLALELAPPARRGLWVGFAVAAYTLPSGAGTLALGRLLRGRSGAQLAGWDAILRAGALAAVPVAYALGMLNIDVYVALLALSSLLHSWGSAGRFTMVVELLPERDRLPANAVLTTISEFATIVGPPLAGLLIGWTSAVWVIGLDAASFAVLALSYRPALPRPERRPARAEHREDGAIAVRHPGFAVIRHDRGLLGLLALTFGFFFLYGPVYVTLPLHVVNDLHGSATVLGALYTAFGLGAVCGGLAAGYLRRWSLWPITIGIVIGFGIATLPLGLGAPVGLSMISLAVGGLIWAPYMATSMALFQRRTNAANLTSVLAANGAVTVLAVPLGSILGGPLTALVGARQTLLICAIGNIAFGLIAAAIGLAYARART